jgi:putative PIN family toxin of toxin-antitoxin system
MTRAVLDTNIIVSALISPFGNEAQVLLAVHQGTILPCCSPTILDEYAGVLGRPKFGFSQSAIDSLIAMMRSRGSTLDPEVIHEASPDPADDAFIACAVAANADFLVTGNKRHFPAAAYGRSRVVSAGELLKILGSLEEGRGR